MWYRSFRQLSDEDLASVVVYLRSLPARNTLPQTVLSEDQIKRFVGEPRPITAPVPEPAQDTLEQRGRYIAGLADCGGCHTLWDGKRLPGAFAGGNEVVAMGAWCSAPTSPPTRPACRTTRRASSR